MAEQNQARLAATRSALTSTVTSGEEQLHKLC
jgi:hypothetical protein